MSFMLMSNLIFEFPVLSITFQSIYFKLKHYPSGENCTEE